MRICIKCKINKKDNHFYPTASSCKKCILKRLSDLRKTDKYKKKTKISVKKWREKNKDKIKLYSMNQTIKRRKYALFSQAVFHIKKAYSLIEKIEEKKLEVIIQEKHIQDENEK